MLIIYFIFINKQINKYKIRYNLKCPAAKWMIFYQIPSQM